MEKHSYHHLCAEYLQMVAEGLQRDPQAWPNYQILTNCTTHLPHPASQQCPQTNTQCVETKLLGLF